VRLHHAPEFDDSGLATLVHIGNCCAKVHAGSNGWIDFGRSLRPHALERLDLTRWNIEDSWGEVVQSMEAIEHFVRC
jgi:hypothetical protein